MPLADANLARPPEQARALAAVPPQPLAGGLVAPFQGPLSQTPRQRPNAAREFRFAVNGLPGHAELPGLSPSERDALKALLTHSPGATELAQARIDQNEALERNAAFMAAALQHDHVFLRCEFHKLAADYDFYHSWHYHSLAANGNPILFVYAEAGNFIAIPLLERAIPDTIYYDLHCVYGYTGPISNLKFADLDDGLMDNFLNAFFLFLDKGNYISVFSKLHPFFSQNELLQRTEGLFENGKTIAINLQQNIEEQRKQYRQTTRDSIKKCRKFGYVAVESKLQPDIAAFAKLYQSNMTRISAADFYLFDEAYFTNLIHSTEFDCKLILIYANQDIVCGSIIMCTNGIIQGHLIATNAIYLKNSPAKFLVDEVSELGRKWNMKYY
ncbi:MAG: hypothetical protein EOO68_33675, partial [Moraxellaceae bacterium]